MLAHSHNPAHSNTLHFHGDHARADFAAGQRSVWISIAVNAVLTVLQLVVGVLAHAQSLVADSLHSLSDLVADGFVLVASKRARHPADRDHPYGHGRIETATSLFLGLALLVVGGGFLWTAGSRLEHLDALPAIDPLALWVALGTLVAKEVLFRYQLSVAKRLRSQMLMANAWHQRADAASSLVVAIGIGGSLLGYAFADLLAAAIVGFMIARMGFNFAWTALSELIDTALPAEEIDGIRQTLRNAQGVRGVHDLRTRRMGRHVLVDAHVLVDGRISVSEGHWIAEAARIAVLRHHPDVLDVLVHIDPEADDANTVCALPLPGRRAVEAALAEVLADFPPPSNVVLHYLADKVDVDVSWVGLSADESLALAGLHSQLEQTLSAYPFMRRVQFFVGDAH